MTNYINDETVEKVRDLADIVQIVSDYLPLKRSGANYVGLCPFHNEKTPSFTVSESKQFFHCFGCGAGGDSVTFIMKKENLGFPEALRFLADKLGIPIEESTPMDPKIVEERDRRYGINKDAAHFFHSNLMKNQNALNYLNKRGINDKIIKQFGLGYALDNWNALHNHLLSKGYNNEEIEELGLIGKRSDNNGYYDKLRNRIIFPIIDTRSRVIGFGGRVLDNTMPKYLNSPETPVFKKGDHLYNLNLLNKWSNRKRILLVEGYMDVIALFNKGINYSVASLGTALTDNQAKLLKRYGENVYICFDSDMAGRNATSKAIQILLNQGISPKIVNLENYKDPDDFLRIEGLEEFEKRINNSLNHIDYGIYINKQKYDISQADGKIKFTIEIAKVIRNLKNSIEKDVYISKIAEELQISKEAIEKEVFGKAMNSNYNNQGQFNRGQLKEFKNILPVKTILPSATLTAEIDLIKLMSFDKKYYDILINEEVLNELENFECSEILKEMNRLYMDSETLDEDLLYKKVKEVPEINIDLVKTISERQINFLPENVEQMITDLINTLNINKIEFKRNLVKKQIEDLEKKEEKDPEELKSFAELCVKLIDLNKEINLIRHDDGR